MRTYTLATLLIASFVLAAPGHALAQATTFQGGTGTSSPYGILYGDASIRLKTVSIGTGLDFTGGVLSASSASFSTTSTDYWYSQSRDWLLSGGYLTPTTTLSVRFPQGFISVGSSTITGNATTTGMHGVGSLFLNNERFTDLTGTGLQLTGGALTLNATGDWTGTFDGQEGTYYLARANHTGTQLASTISDFTSAAQAALSGLYEVPLTFSAPFRRISNTIDWTGLATTTQPSSSNLLVSNGGAGVYGVATSTLSATSPLTGSFTQVGSGGSLGCQTASGAQTGCLSSTDWTTFNGKENALSFTYPLSRAVNAISLAFSTTTANTWSQTNIFSGIMQAARVIVSGLSASFTPSSEGEIGIDTSEASQVKYYAGGAVRTLSPVIFRSFGYATTSWTGTTTLPLGPAGSSETWQYIKCVTNTGTAQVSVYDGTNRMNFVNASTTVGTTTLSTNNSFFSSEARYVDIGTPASSPTRIGCTAAITIDAI